MNERLDIINHEQLKQTIKKCYKTGRALFVRGAPGIGKSQHIETVEREIAKEEQREFFNWNESTEKQKTELKNPETLKKYFIFAVERISLCDPSDLKGLPQLNGGEYMKWISPLLYKIASMEEFRGCIFFDEMNTAPPLTQNTSMHIVLDKQLADLALNKHLQIIAAGNRGIDRGHTFEMPLPLLNRFMHSELKNPSVEEWTAWALKHEIDERIIAYINFKQDHLFMITKDSEEWAFPTPRTNAFLSQQIKGETDENTIKMLASQAVGNSYAMSFTAFIRLSYTLKLKDVIENPEKELKKLEKEEQEKSMGIKWSLTSALAEYYRNNTKDLGKVLNVCTYLEPEFSRLVIRFCRQTDPRGTETFDKIMIKTPEFIKHAKKLEQYLM